MGLVFGLKFRRCRRARLMLGLFIAVVSGFAVATAATGQGQGQPPAVAGVGDR